MGNILGSSDQCINNLKPTTAPGINDMGEGEVSQITNIGETVLQTGGFFKENLEIVKMELKSEITTPDDPKGNNVTRNFLVYYKKRIVGKQATLGGEQCTSTNQDGCYFSQCRIVYKLNAGGTDVEGCSMLDCTGGEEGISCYTADEIDSAYPAVAGETGDARTLVGCGGTSEIERSTITAFGFGAGASNNADGIMNTYIGYKAGTSNTDFDYNTIIGYEAGQNIQGGNNVFVGSQVGYANTNGGHNVFVGDRAGYENTGGSHNVFLGFQTGYGNTGGNRNTYIGGQAGYSYDDINSVPLANFDSKRNVFIGYQAGKDNTKGSEHTFIGHEAGKGHMEGKWSIYIGKEAGPNGAGMIGTGTQSGRQLNIGNLILGRVHNPTSSLQNSPNIPSYGDKGVVINGDLIVKGKVYSYGLNFSDPCSGTACDPVHYSPLSSIPIGSIYVASSKEYKKNIKPFKNYEKALDDIVNTPLFTYKYKKDRPEKSRMGIISEELPKHLQLEEKVDPRLRGDDSSRGDGDASTDDSKKKGSKWKGFSKKKSKKVEKVSMPDWASIYGTFWAGIKSLFIQFKSFKEKMYAELKQLKAQFTNALKLAEGNKNTIGELNVLLEDASTISKANQEESDTRNQELAKLQKLLKQTTEELQLAQKEIQQIKELMKKRNKAQCPSVSPIVSENNNLHDYDFFKEVALSRRVRQFSSCYKFN